MMKDLVDPGLFGNEAGEDETPDILNSYFLEKPDFDRFYSSNERFMVVRSRKGMGKSALLRQTMYKRRAANNAALVFYVKGADLAAHCSPGEHSPGAFVNAWQQRICTQLAIEIASVVRPAAGNNLMPLVDAGDIASFRGKNIVSCLLERLVGKVEGAAPPLSAGHGADNAIVWLLVDDLDATFMNVDEQRLAASTFFSACRNLCSSVSGLNVRASVRTDVWTILAQSDESLDKCEQYILDLRWSTVETGQILERKIISFFRRQYPTNRRYISLKPKTDSASIFKLVFAEPFLWNNRPVEAFRPIHILSAGRPRWAAQLCKMAGRNAATQRRDLIRLGDITSQLREYGQARVDDIYKEHRHQCAKLETVIEGFAGGPKRYSTRDLLNRIANYIIGEVGVVDVDGVKAGAIEIAHFLYRVGFICARDEADESATLGFVRFEDRPNLLRVRANLDDGLGWEIHPSYRSVLRIGGLSALDE